MGSFHYYAFISYSHSDEKWAKWLHRKLENYKLPNLIRHDYPNHIPTKIRPIFRDKTDLASGNLERKLRSELADSKYLIVICSRASAKSEWVNKEIRAFKEMGRQDRIIPFIIEDIPSPDLCFPDELSNEMLGLSVFESGRESAFLKLVATILQIKPDLLFQRHNRRYNVLTIRNFILIYISILFLALILFGSVYKYPTDYQQQNIRVGVCLLSGLVFAALPSFLIIKNASIKFYSQLNAFIIGFIALYYIDPQKFVIENLKQQSPSPGLAYGYYYNFLKPVADNYIDNGYAIVDGVKHQDFKIVVCMPVNLEDYDRNAFEVYFESANISSGKSRPFSLYHLKTIASDDVVYDVPTTLNTLKQYIRRRIGSDFDYRNSDCVRIAMEEIKNFSDEIKGLIQSDSIIRTSHIIAIRDSQPLSVLLK